MVKTHQEFISEISNRPITAIGLYTKSKTKICFKCDIDGNVWMARPNDILNGKGCPVCGAESARLKRLKTNEILEDHGSWLLIEIAIPERKTATMKVDSYIWKEYKHGRVSAVIGGKNRTHIAARYSCYGLHLFHHIVLPKRQGFEIDHKNHDSINCVDNRRCNLRYSTRSQNLMNIGLRKANTSGTTGVYWSGKGKNWTAKIKINRSNINLGSFAEKEDAIKARKLAEIEYFGEYLYSKNN